MKRSAPGAQRIGRQNGFAVVSAMFLIVALAVLGAYVATVSSTQHVSSAQDVQGARAYWAAKGGIQWAAGVIASTSLCPAGNPNFTDGFAVAVVCQRLTYVEGATPRDVYWLRATASSTGAVGDPGFVERQVQAFIE